MTSATLTLGDSWCCPMSMSPRSSRGACQGMTSATLTLGSTSCRPLRGMSSTASSVMSAALLLTFTSVPPGPWVRSLHQRLGLTAGEPIDARQQGSFLVGLAEVVIHSQGPGPLAVLVAGAGGDHDDGK